MSDVAEWAIAVTLIAFMLWLNAWPWVQRRRYIHADFSYVSRFTISNTSVELKTSMAHKELGDFTSQVLRIKLPGIGWQKVRWVQVDYSMTTYAYRFEFIKPLVGQPRN